MSFLNIREENITVQTQPQSKRDRGFEVVDRKFIEKVLSADENNNPIGYVKTERPIFPVRGSASSAGYDFVFNGVEPVSIDAGEVVSFYTHIKAYMPSSEFLMITVRSSVGIKRNLALSNTTGIIDSDYYNNPNNGGNIVISLRNIGTEPVTIKPNERLAQGIFVRFYPSDNCNANDVKRLGGVGSTDSEE